MNRDSENPSSDAELDATIRRALHVEVDDERLARLSGYWQAQSQAERWRRRTVRIVAAVSAAAALLAVIVVWQRMDEPPMGRVAQVPPTSPAVEKDSEPVKIAPTIESNAAPVVESVQIVTPHPASRPPTAYQQFVFASRSRVEPAPREVATTIDTVIHDVATNPGIDAPHALAAAGISNSEAESRLLRKLSSARAEHRVAIVKLLADCGSRRSVPALVRLSRNEAIRSESLAAIERIVEPAKLPELIAGMPHSKERSALLDRLLASDDDAAIVGYLSLVGNQATRADALAQAKAAPKLRVDELFALLDHDEESVRIAAGMLLGHVNGPEISRRLIARVTDEPSASPEAWLALTACRGEAANEFLDYATHRPQLLVHVNNARVRWVQMIY